MAKRARLVVPYDENDYDENGWPKSLQPLVIDWGESGLSEVEETVANAEAAPLRRSLHQLMVLMERPFFALSKRQKLPAEYTSPDGKIEVRIEPGLAGMATIYDADIVMFLVDQLHRGEVVQKEVVFKPAEYLVAVGSKLGGDQYRLLGEAIERLRTTRVTTNAQPNGKSGSWCTFCWLEAATREGRDWHLTVSDWLLEGARSSSVLSIIPGYFELSGFERFLYLTARKHIGNVRYKEFSIGLKTLREKFGSRSQESRFRYEMKRLARQNTLPDYSLQWREQVRRDPQLIFSLR